MNFWDTYKIEYFHNGILPAFRYFAFAQLVIYMIYTEEQQG